MRTTLALIILLLPCIVFGQQERPEQGKYVVAPKENTLITVASQHDCPLRIEEVQLLLNTEVTWDFRFRYQVRNAGSKSIKRFRLAFLTSEGTGGTINDRRLNGRELLPGQSILPDTTTAGASIVPLTEGLAKQMKLGPPMKMVVVILVEKVEFADGSIYSDESASLAVRNYFRDLSGARE